MLDQRGRNENARESLLSPSSFLVIFLSPSFVSRTLDRLLVDRNKQRSTRRGSICQRRRNIGVKKRERRDAVLLPDGNTSGRKGAGVVRKWTDRRKRLATGFPSTDARRKTPAPHRAFVEISADSAGPHWNAAHFFFLSPGA